VVTVVAGPVDLPEISEAQLREAAEVMREGIVDVVGQVFPAFRPALEQYYQWLGATVPPEVVAAIADLLTVTGQAVELLANLVISALEGAVVPISAGIRAGLWQGEIEVYSTCAADLRRVVDDVRVSWGGPAAEAFEVHAERQLARLAVFEKVCTANRGTLVSVLCLGLSLYLALAAVVCTLVIKMKLAVATTPLTGGAAVAVGAAAALDAALAVSALVSAALGLLPSMVRELVATSDTLRLLAGEWPSPPGVGYADGSASDGDRSDWSTER